MVAQYLEKIMSELIGAFLSNTDTKLCIFGSQNLFKYFSLGEISTTKKYHPVSPLSVVSEVFEKLVNNRLVNHLEKCGLFSDFQYGFVSS